MRESNYTITILGSIDYNNIMLNWIKKNPKKSIMLGISVIGICSLAKLIYKYKGHITALIHLRSTLANAKNLLGTDLQG